MHRFTAATFAALLTCAGLIGCRQDAPPRPQFPGNLAAKDSGADGELMPADVAPRDAAYLLMDQSSDGLSRLSQAGAAPAAVGAVPASQPAAPASAPASAPAPEPGA